MSAIAAAPTWVFGLSIDSGAWRCLVGLWSYAPFNYKPDPRVADPRPRVWPSREDLAARTGQTVRAIKGQLSKLHKLGLIEWQPGKARMHGQWRLTVAPPVDVDASSPTHESTEEPTQLSLPEPPMHRIAADVERPSVGHHGDQARPLNGPPINLQELPGELAEQNNDARTREDRGNVVDIADQRRQAVIAERNRIEDEVIRIVRDANVGAGVDPPPSYVADMVRRVSSQGADGITLDELADILAEYKRRKDRGDASQSHVRVLFYDRVWPSTLRGYLGRSAPTKQRSPTSALAHTRDEWAAIRSEPEPELDEEFLNLPNRVGGMS